MPESPFLFLCERSYIIGVNRLIVVGEVVYKFCNDNILAVDSATHRYMELPVHRKPDFLAYVPGNYRILCIAIDLHSVIYLAGDCGLMTKMIGPADLLKDDVSLSGSTPCNRLVDARADVTAHSSSTFQVGCDGCCDHRRLIPLRE